jgi:predicted ATP-grasp superfamily ATP-dependent carboligase
VKFEVPAIVLGGGINGLGVVRNLGRSGVTVYCIAEKKEEVMFSRFCKKTYVVPNVQKSKAILRNLLFDTRKINDNAVLFPTSDLYSLHLSELKEELQDDYYIPLPSHEVVRTLIDKRRFYQSLSEARVPHPLTYFPELISDVRRISNEIGYPAFVKPSNSQEFGMKFHTKGFVAKSADELIKYYRLASKHKIDVIFQEVIPGLAGKNIYGIEGYFDKNSDPRAVFAYRRLRGWPPVFGNTCLRESISVSDVINQYAITRNYLHNLKYHGLMEAEWKRDPRTHIFKLLEINARQSMQNTLPTACGVNLVLLAYLDAIGKKTKYVNGYEKGIGWASFPADLLSVIETHTSIREWISSLKTVKSWSFFAADDLLPWIIGSVETAEEAAKRLRRSSIDRSDSVGLQCAGLSLN